MLLFITTVQSALVPENKNRISANHDLWLRNKHTGNLFMEYRLSGLISAISGFHSAY